MTDSPLPPAPRRPSSGTFVTISPDRIPAAVVDLVQWKSVTEDWKGRQSQRIAKLEERCEDLETENADLRRENAAQFAKYNEAQQNHALSRADFERQLDNRFAGLEKTIAVAEAKVRSMATTLFVCFTILTTLVGLAVRFL